MACVIAFVLVLHRTSQVQLAWSPRVSWRPWSNFEGFQTGQQQCDTQP